MILQGRTNSAIGTAYCSCWPLIAATLLPMSFVWSADPPKQEQARRPQTDSRSKETVPPANSITTTIPAVIPEDAKHSKADQGQHQVLVDVLVVQTTKDEWKKVASLLGERIEGDSNATYEMRRARIKDLEKSLGKSLQGKVIAHPRLVTFTGRRAMLRTGGELEILLPGPNGATKREVRDLGMSIEIEPRILESGKIQSVFTFENKELLYENGVQLGEQVVPALRAARVESSWKCRPNEGVLFAVKTDRDGKQDMTIVVVEVARVTAAGKMARSLPEKTSNHK